MERGRPSEAWSLSREAGFSSYETAARRSRGLEHEQYVMLVLLDDSNEFWRLRDQLAVERRPESG